MEQNLERKFLDVKDLRQPPWNLSQHDAYALVKRKDFPKIMFGKRVKIIASELDSYFANNIGSKLVKERY